MKKRSWRLAAACVAVSLCAAGVAAAAQPPAPGALVTVRLVASPPEPGRPSSAWLGLAFDIADGWHIYWQNPGDTGGPPDARWTVPQGMTVGSLRWPVPERIPADGMVNFGYHGKVVLPVSLEAAAGWPAVPFTVKAEVRWVACRDICVPGKAEVSLELPGRMAVGSLTGAPGIRAALDRVPRTVPRGWRLTGTATKDGFVLTVATGRRETGADFFPSEPGQVDAAAPVLVTPRAQGLAVTLRKSEYLDKPIRHLKGVLVLQGVAYDVAVPMTD